MLTQLLVENSVVSEINKNFHDKTFEYAAAIEHYTKRYIEINLSFWNFERAQENGKFVYVYRFLLYIVIIHIKIVMIDVH